MAGRFPRAYANEVPTNPENVGMMEYVPFDRMDIGARKSTLRSIAPGGLKRIDHVGGSAGGKD
jgi:hypothetical protein